MDSAIRIRGILPCYRLVNRYLFNSFRHSFSAVPRYRPSYDTSSPLYLYSYLWG
ncbi:hypothetical protein PAHAL_3G338500 [Panicum hallii]|uniref:Uncharacterized protein n=1 Tax=Panicum hallii TaxID=206008 RepID=A0A2T8KKB4_9POAL|nr:hypothetical protein PAHAL_3G338500 [Panicum hallii]